MEVEIDTSSTGFRRLDLDRFNKNKWRVTATINLVCEESVSRADLSRIENLILAICFERRLLKVVDKKTFHQDLDRQSSIDLH